jgi:dihydroxyacetone kinase phosphotransfer subunit
MVGIVIVSHSAKIAEGIKELVSEMGNKEQKIIAAGGMMDGSIGTDAVRISEAITEADTGDGVVILVDLGSAVLSTNMALELLEEENSKKYLIADAPILEGAFSAVIQASCGSDLNEVLNSAQDAKKMTKIMD